MTGIKGIGRAGALLAGASALVFGVHAPLHGQVHGSAQGHVPVQGHALAQGQASGPGHAAAQGHATAPARARRVAPITALFEAAGRGEIAPLERAIADRSTSGDVRLLLRARLALGRFDLSLAHDPVIARLAASPDAALRRAALSILSTAAFVAGDFAESARRGRSLVELLRAAGEPAGHVESAAQLAGILASQPRQSVEGAVAAGSARARTDSVGLPRVDLSINGRTQDAVFDTGANLSVLSADTARQLGVRVIEGTTPIGNSLETTVPARIGIADRVEIAGTVFRNVAFLIIDDSQLTFQIPTGTYEINAILGMPEMRRLGRMRMERDRLVVLPSEGGNAQGNSNLRANGNLLFIDTQLDGGPVPLALDTGANRSDLSALYSERNPAVVAALETRDTHVGGAGGMQVQRLAVWRNVPVELAGRRTTLPMLQVALPSSGGPMPSRSYGKLGADVLRAFASYTLDLNAMRLDLGEPVAAGSH